MSRKSSHLNKNILKDSLGTKCCNCGKECNNNIIYHHVVPIILGGKDIITNIVPICTECHSIIHHGSKKNQSIDHSVLIKEGIKRAKENNVHVGRRQIVLEDIPQDFFKYYKLIQNNEITKKEAAYRLNLSRNTLYKYIKIYEQTLINKI